MADGLGEGRGLRGVRVEGRHLPVGDGGAVHGQRQVGLRGAGRLGLPQPDLFVELAPAGVERRGQRGVEERPGLAGLVPGVGHPPVDGTVVVVPGHALRPERDDGVGPHRGDPAADERRAVAGEDRAAPAVGQAQDRVLVDAHGGQGGP